MKRARVEQQERNEGASNVRQEFHEECERGINKQINLELYAMYTYMSMANYFDRHNVALPGCSKFFKKSAMEELEHAQKLMDYQNKRGGKVVLGDIKTPAKADWGTALDAFKDAQELERTVNKALLDLHTCSDSHKDYQMSDFLEGEYLKEQVDAIKELGDYITQLERCGPGHGEYHFDKELND